MSTISTLFLLPNLPQARISRAKTLGTSLKLPRQQLILVRVVTLLPPGTRRSFLTRQEVIEVQEMWLEQAQSVAAVLLALAEANLSRHLLAVRWESVWHPTAKMITMEIRAS